ncbi:MAG: tRNA threonylcarbamoyladenosine dehydratase [Rhodoferax sp.]|uniref:tRNA threonylcarbamoyladenosine dehydratase n=1 Tax=Rhodoferax sp. TaxID=50421 RepID=UPI00260B76CA|nr:tRNA threonylcarbamoyladenosine dehydratase [Rhodoferax sp.]MDD2879268.1 tRNA threonylcarbamoyladenosine dehydratase [Rhodoferax sp.]
MSDDRRFGGVERLFGLDGAQRIRDAHVAVVGIGGVGSWVAESLARSGVGQLTLIDFDQVAESNINRQIHATEASLGLAKIHAMRERIHSFFPQCNVTCLEEFAEPDNWPSMLPAGVNAVVDACDQTSAKTAIAAWAIRSKGIHVAVGAAGGKRHAQLVTVADMVEVTHDPLLAKVRYQLRKEHAAPREGKKMGVTCVFSRELVAPPDASCGIFGDGSLNCHGFGSLVTVTATFGQCAAGVILNKLAADC